MTFCCVLICLSACLCFASFVSHWHSHSQLLYPFSSVCLPPTWRCLRQLMLASEAHTLSLSTHCKLHRELKGGKEMLFTFSMALFTSYFRACACAFAMHTDTHVFLFGFSVSCVRSSFSYAWVFHKTKWHSGTAWHHSGLSICIFECAFSASSSSALILPTVARISEIVNTRVKQMYRCKTISALSVWFCFQHFWSCFFYVLLRFFYCGCVKTVNGLYNSEI